MEDKISLMQLRNILFVTMPSNPDDPTIMALQNKVLTALEETEARGLILDISTVDIMDSFFARTLNETVQMIALMGGETIIVGMRPSVAITTTQLGLNLGNIKTALNMDAALQILAPSGNEG